MDHPNLTEAARTLATGTTQLVEMAREQDRELTNLRAELSIAKSDALAADTMLAEVLANKQAVANGHRGSSPLLDAVEAYTVKLYANDEQQLDYLRRRGWQAAATGNGVQPPKVDGHPIPYATYGLASGVERQVVVDTKPFRHLVNVQK